MSFTGINTATSINWIFFGTVYYLFLWLPDGEMLLHQVHSGAWFLFTKILNSFECTEQFLWMHFLMCLSPSFFLSLWNTLLSQIVCCLQAYKWGHSSEEIYLTASNICPLLFCSWMTWKILDHFLNCENEEVYFFFRS